MLGEIGAAFLSAFLQVLFERIAPRDVVDFFLNRPNEALLLEKLKDNFLSLKAVLGDAEEKQFIDPHVREWVDMLKDAAFDVDDIFDDIATKTRKHSQSHNILNEVLNYASSFDPLAERVRTKLEFINEKLKSLVDNKDLLGLKEGDVGKQYPLSYPTTSLVNVNEVFGRDGDRDKVKEFLLSRNENEREVSVSVIAIVGMAGVGKTTLAQLLFNDAQVRNRFPSTSWANVSGGLDVYETTKRIHVSVDKFKDSNTTDMNLLQLDLQNWSEEQPFLLVLDDFWNESFLDWDMLKRPFESGNSESRIIVTTRNQNVALAIRADWTYPLFQLSDSDCWKLFSSHAFKSGNPDKHPALKDIGVSIAERCKGLPLAAKSLGSLLRFKEDPEEWRSILDSQIWELPNNKSNILPALRLSYYLLPSHLKRCFAYCSIFPKGAKTEKWRLICLWMAEGILPQQRTSKRVEDVGAECFQELVSRSFFQLVDQGTSFQMHDLINDLAQYVLGEFCSKLEDIKSRKAGVRLRRVSYIQTRDDGPEKFDALNEHQSSLRTFLPFRTGLRLVYHSALSDPFVQQLKNFTHLRVLSLSNYGITKLPGSIKRLKHLRYLDLSRTNIHQLSPSIVQLYNLETLLLSNCYNLIELPSYMFKLTNLRHLDVSGCSRLEAMPAQVGKIQALQMLRDFVVTVSTQGGAGLSELGKLSQLHTLSMLKVENVVSAEGAFEASLQSKQCLRELELEWTSSLDQDREAMVLSKLQPHDNLTSLKIKKFYGNKLPDWMGSPSFCGLVFLRLENCKNCSSLPSLGQLPSLRELHILNMQGVVKVGPEFCGNGVPFLSLQILKFERMPNWEEWSPGPNSRGEAVVLASLQLFSIKNCPILKGDLSQFPEDHKLQVLGSPDIEALLQQRSSIP